MVCWGRGVVYGSWGVIDRSWGVVDRRWGVVGRNWGVVGRSRSMVYRGRGVVWCSSRSCGILGLTVIGDFCNVSIVSVRGVGYMLDTAVRESYRVGS